ncbi:MAG: hypothetical protein A2Y17_00460 [Clostridiales bacterium GWF2_38_85]|nr:MAG: hypothetical protein A2Y17_00460 [Clostridiales bacterium GWF2_38_85]HBL83533.1 hypothetical protein [Clostridiales bacterium]
MKLKNKNWFWGLFLLFLAVFIIAIQIGSFSEIGTMTIIATALIFAMIITSLIKLQFFGVFVPLAFLYMIFEKPLNLPDISGWLLILVALMLTAGIDMLFPHHRRRHGVFCRNSSKGEELNGNKVYAKTSFSEASKYLHSESLKNGEFNVSFGELNVYFDQAQLDPNGAEVYLDCNFGSMNVFIPRDWKVIDKLQANLGSVEHQHNSTVLAGDAPCLTLSGNVRFGSIEIKYV